MEKPKVKAKRPRIKRNIGLKRQCGHCLGASGSYELVLCDSCGVYTCIVCAMGCPVPWCNS